MSIYNEGPYELDIMKKGKDFVFYLLKIDQMDRSREIWDDFDFTSSILRFNGFNSENGNIKFRTNCAMDFQVDTSEWASNFDVWNTHVVHIIDRLNTSIDENTNEKVNDKVSAMLTMRAMQILGSVLTVKDKADMAEQMLDKDYYQDIRRFTDAIEKRKKEKFPNVTWDRVVEEKDLWVAEKNMEKAFEAELKLQKKEAAKWRNQKSK